MPKFRCFVRSSCVVEAETAEDALQAYEEMLANYGFSWLGYTGVEGCSQDLEPTLIADEDDCEDEDD